MAGPNPYEPKDILTNAASTPEGKQRLLDAEKTWTAPRLVALVAVTLAAAFFLLHTMALTTAEVSYPRWWLP